jgi:queuosine biosynthesis protein QueC
MSLLPPGNGRDAVVLLSGGLDSMVVAGLAVEAGYRVNALTIDYNQRHRRELDAARTIAVRVGAARHVILPLDLRRFGGSALTDEIDVPKGGVVESDIPVTYVPARNLVFLSLTLAWAEALGARDVCIGVNALDYSGYPDCRPEFIAGFAHLAELATKAGAVPRQGRDCARGRSAGAGPGDELVVLRPERRRPSLRPVRQLPAAARGIRVGRPSGWARLCSRLRTPSARSTLTATTSSAC